MTKFDYMGFHDGCRETCFVANAKKYTKEQTIDLCIIENEPRFEPDYQHGRFRKPTVEDIAEGFCAFRFGLYEFPEGAYTPVGAGEPGAFPVFVIDYESLAID